MNAWRTADAVVGRLEAAIPVYDVSERGRSLVDAPFEGDVGVAAELRVRDDAGGWAR